MKIWHKRWGSLNSIRGRPFFYRKSSLGRLHWKSSYSRLTFFIFCAHNRICVPYTYVESALALHAAPCLAGIKPANLVGFATPDVQWCSAYNTLLNTRGIYFTPLYVYKNRAQVLVYRKDLLHQLCVDSRVAQALHAFGYETHKGIETIIAVLKKKMEALALKRDGCCKDIYPHEIGLFLGYPVEDVMQYVKTGGRNCLFCGYWKVYSNPEQARRIFHHYTECKERFALQIKSGMTLSQIVCAA